MAIDINELRKVIADCYWPTSPVTINELLDRFEAVESEAIEQARLNGMGSEREAALMAKLEAAEKERDDVAQQLVQSEQGKRKISKECESYKAAYNDWADKTEWVQQGFNEGTISAKYLGLHRADVMARLLGEAEKERDECNSRRLEAADHFAAQTALMKEKCDTLRAKIEQMERQEPVAWRYQDVRGNHRYRSYVAGFDVEYRALTPIPLYALPGAKGEEK